MTLRSPLFTPILGRPAPIENRTWLWQGNALIGGGVEPFAQTDWPNPRGYPFPIENRWSGQGRNIALFIEPFYQTDWPNPRGYQPPVENRWSGQGLNPNLFGGGTEPFYQTDWPTPRGYPTPIENRVWLWQGNALLGAGLQPTAVHNQFDWPVPRGYAFPIENRNFTFRGNALIGGGVAPFAQTDWQNPRGYQFPIENRGAGYNNTIPQPPPPVIVNVQLIGRHGMVPGQPMGFTIGL